MTENTNCFHLFFLLLLTVCNGQNKVGDKIPEYVFKNLLNTSQQSFNVSNQNKPLVLEFWATWCSPCIPAMKKLEGFQKKYHGEIEILTISTEDPKNLLRYIENTNTTLKIAYDTVHLKTFEYKYIPHTILIDKNGFIKAITTPDKISDELMAQFILGEDIKIINEKDVYSSDFNLNKEVNNRLFQFKLTSENKKLNFKNEIKRDELGVPISLEFNNVSIYRLLTDIYELSSVERIYEEKKFSNKNKYCFKLEQSNTLDKTLLQNAKELLNEHSNVKASIVEKTLDSVYVLEIHDVTKLPIISSEKEKIVEFRGPSYRGKKVTSYNLIEYLENEIQKLVKDKTGLSYSFDIELNWDYAKTTSLNEELKKYGLFIKKSDKPEKITLLEIKTISTL